MKKWWKKLEQRLEGISRGKKLAVNLALCTFVLLLLWSLFGYPLPTAELEFRRMERAHLMPRSEIIFNGEKDCPLQWKDLPELDMRHRAVLVGLGEGYACVADPAYNIMRRYPIGEGISPVPMFNCSALSVPAPGRLRSGVPLLLLNVPAEAERAELTLDATDYEGQPLHYRGEGWRLAPGRWLFCAYPGDAFSGNWYAGGSYTLTLFREDGSPLLEQSGTLPEE